MDGLETTLNRLGASLSHLLDPVANALLRLGAMIRTQMDAFGLPYQYQGPALTALWVIVLFLVLRSLAGWLRIVVLIAVLVILAKMYGYLPGG